MKKLIIAHDAMLASTKKAHTFLSSLALFSCITFYFVPYPAMFLMGVSIIGLLLFAGFGMAMNIFIKKLTQKQMYTSEKPYYSAITPALTLLAIMVLLSVNAYFFSPPMEMLQNLAKIWLIMATMCFIITVVFSLLFLFILRSHFPYLSNPEERYQEDLMWLTTYMDVAKLDERNKLYIYNQVEDTSATSSKIRISLSNGSCTLFRKVKNALKKKTS
jgi:hypothetical protein